MEKSTYKHDSCLETEIKVEAASKDYSEKPQKKGSQKTEDIFKVDFIADREIMFKMIELIDLAKRETLIASPWI